MYSSHELYKFYKIEINYKFFQLSLKNVDKWYYFINFINKNMLTINKIIFIVIC